VGDIVKVKGEVDLYSSPALREAILKAVQGAKGPGIAVDLSDVPYMDSSGVATLVEGLKASNQGKKQFTLLSPSAAVARVLELARLNSVFEIKGQQ
jgi:anti-sigma B factor antagonist